ncbi:MAG: hypothetical protein HXP18_01745 [Veillonella sp.]|nr:hypothetical protein [Veillonella sp.]
MIVVKIFVKHEDGKEFQVQYVVSFWVRGDRRNPINNRRHDTLTAGRRDASMLRKKYNYETMISESHIPVII